MIQVKNAIIKLQHTLIRLSQKQRNKFQLKDNTIQVVTGKVQNFKQSAKTHGMQP